MFKSLKFLTLLCVLALSLVSTAHAKDSAAQAADRRAIVAAYKAMDAAMKNKNTAAAMAYIAPDYRAYTENRGVFDRAAFEQIMNVMNASEARFVSNQTTITKFQWRGPDAIVWVKSATRAVGGRGTMIGKYTNRQYWGKINGRWQIRQDVTLSRKATLNGKPMK